MKKSLLMAAFVALFLGMTYYLSTTYSSSARAQGRPQRIDRGVAVVDLKYIFDRYPRFTQAKEAMQNQVKAAEVQVKGYKVQVEKEIKRRDGFNRGSANYDEVDSRVMKMKIELSAMFQNQKKRFLRDEASIYFKAYKEIVQQVEAYASDRGYSIVFRFNSDLLNNDHDVREVAKHLNKPVVWLKPNSRDPFDPSNRDITGAVLEILIQRTGGQAHRQRSGVPTPRR